MKHHSLPRVLLLLFVLACSLVGLGCVLDRPAYPDTLAWTDPELDSFKLSDREKALWQDAEKLQKEMLDAGELLEAPGLETYLLKVAQSLAPALPDSGPKLRVFVLAEAERSAYARLNGDIMISAGLLASFENEAQLAFILGHEISHIARRNIIQKDLYRDATPSHVDRMLLSRKLETEADKEGFRMAVNAGYEPNQAALALEHLQDQAPESRGRIRSWESHRDVAERADSLRFYARKSSRYGEGLKKTLPFLEQIDSIRLEVAELEIKAGRLPIAKKRVQQHLSRNPRSASAHYLIAEVIRKLSPEGRKDPLVEMHYRHAVQYAPNDAPAIRGLGLTLRTSSKKSESTPLLRRYLELSPEAEDRELIEQYIERDAAVTNP